MGFRTNLVNKSAAHLMERGERIERLAVGRAAERDASGDYAVAASESNVYVFELSSLAFGRVGRRVMKIGIGKAAVNRAGRFITVGRRGAKKPDHVFEALPGPGVRRLVAYVAERGGGAGP
jgi:hypothetical protein